MSDSEWFTADCPQCLTAARWQAVRNDGFGPPKLRIRCPVCGDSGEDAALLAEVIKGDAA